MTPEKGVRSLVQAWLMWGPKAPELRIVGDGYLRVELERLASIAPEAKSAVWILPSCTLSIPVSPLICTAITLPPELLVYLR